MTEKERKDNERKQQLLLLQALKIINGANPIKTETQGKRMKVNFDLLKAFKKPVLTTSQTNRILQLIMDDIKSRTPVDTGRLKGAIRKRVTAPGKGEVYIDGKRNNEVARYNHDGTEAHFVAPVKAKALHWVAGGKDYYSKGHMVSGIIGTEFFSPSPKVLKEVRTLVYKYYKDNLKLQFV